MENSQEVADKPAVTTAPLLHPVRVAQAETEAEPVAEPPKVAVEADPESVPEEPKVPIAAVAQVETPIAPAGVKPPKRSRKRILLIVLFVLVNLGLAGANGYLMTNKKSDVPTVAVTATKATTTSKKAGAKVTASTDIKTLHYVSKPLGIEFDYPVDWRVSSDAANTSISLTSAPFSFTDTSGQARAANISLSITPASQAGATYTVVYDGDVIGADSESLTYAKPTSGQRKQTNISFASTSNTNPKELSYGFVSGTYVYKSGDAVSSQEHAKVDPQIAFYINPCGNEKCQALNTTSFAISDWKTNSNLQQVKALLESLRIN
jgi:hypothetical protein